MTSIGSFARGIRWRSLPVVVGLLVIAGGVLSGVGLFFDFFVHRSFGPATFARSDVTSFLVFDCITAAAVVLIGLLLVLRPSARAFAAAALVVLAATLTNAHVGPLTLVWQPQGPHASAGLYLNEIGFAFVLLGAVLAGFVVLAPAIAHAGWTLHNRGKLATLAAGLGLSTAVGYGLNPYSINFNPGGGRASGLGSPFFFDSTFAHGPRVLWSAILVAVVLTTAPIVVVALRSRALAGGITFAMLVFVVAEALSRLIHDFDNTGLSLPTKTIEGTWTFIAAGFALVLVLAYRVRGFSDSEPVPDAATRQRVWAMSDTWVDALRQSAAMLAIAAGGLITLALFLPFVFGYSLAYRDFDELLAYYAAIAAGVFVSGVLLTRRKSSMVGATSLGVIALLLVVQRANNILPTAGHTTTGSGGWVADMGAVLALVAAVLAVIALIARIEREEQLRSAPRPLILVSALVSFAAAVGFGMPFSKGFVFPQGPVSPYFFDQLAPNARALGSGLFVVTLLCVLPVCAVMIRRRSVAAGMWLGLAVFVLAIGVYRLLFVYSGDLARLLFPSPSNTQGRAIEGTWTFLAAGGAVLLLLGYRVLTMGSARDQVASA